MDPILRALARIASTIALFADPTTPQLKETEPQLKAEIDLDALADKIADRLKSGPAAPASEPIPHPSALVLTETEAEFIRVNREAGSEGFLKNTAKTLKQKAGLGKKLAQDRKNG